MAQVYSKGYTTTVETTEIQKSECDNFIPMEQLWRELYNKKYEERLMEYKDCHMLILRMFSAQTHGTNMTISMFIT